MGKEKQLMDINEKEYNPALPANKIGEEQNNG